MVVKTADSVLPPAIDVSRHTFTGVYFARAGDWVKIGHTDDVAARISDLQTACPLTIRVLAIASGGRAQEREFHRRLASSAMRLVHSVASARASGSVIAGRMASSLRLPPTVTRAHQRPFFQTGDPVAGLAMVSLRRRRRRVHRLDGIEDAPGVRGVARGEGEGDHGLIPSASISSGVSFASACLRRSAAICTHRLPSNSSISIGASFGQPTLTSTL